LYLLFRHCLTRTCCNDLQQRRLKASRKSRLGRAWFAILVKFDDAHQFRKPTFLATSTTNCGCSCDLLAPSCLWPIAGLSFHLLWWYKNVTILQSDRAIRPRSLQSTSAPQFRWVCNSPCRPSKTAYVFVHTKGIINFRC
jgi:hypothetical protein